MVIFEVPDTETEKIARIQKILKPREKKTEEQKKIEISERNKRKYEEKRQKLIAEGVVIRPRGRPRKNAVTEVNIAV